MSQESQAIDVSRFESPSKFVGSVRILQPSPSKQITAYTMIKYKDLGGEKIDTLTLFRDGSLEQKVDSKIFILNTDRTLLH